jgi:hypothetical protein
MANPIFHVLAGMDLLTTESTEDTENCKEFLATDGEPMNTDVEWIGNDAPFSHPTIMMTELK